METDIDTTLLIKEIERRPTIWDKRRSDHNDKLAKQKCWDELTELFSPARISKKNKQELHFLLQNRWKNVKDLFARSLKAENRRKSQYVHSPVLQFLLHSKRNMKNARSTKNAVPKSRRTPSTSAKSGQVPKRKSKPPSTKRARSNNSLVAPRSKIITSSETTEDRSISIEISNSSEDESTSSGIPNGSEEPSNPPSEKRKNSNNSFVTLTSKNTNTQFDSSKILNVQIEKLNPSLEKKIRTGNSLVTSNNTQSASSEILNVLEEQIYPHPEIRAQTESSSVSSVDVPSFLSEILYVPEEESKPLPEERIKPHNNLVEAKLIEFLERNMMELQDVTKNSQDEDRLFLLSLLTSLKSIQPQFQLKAKIEILSVLDKYPKMYEEAILPEPQIFEVRHSVNM